jgi:hypothetical protein
LETSVQVQRSRETPQPGAGAECVDGATGCKRRQQTIAVGLNRLHCRCRGRLVDGEGGMRARPVQEPLELRHLRRRHHDDHSDL